MQRNGTEETYPVKNDEGDEVENIKNALNKVIEDEKRSNIKQVTVETIDKPLSGESKTITIQYEK